MFSKPFTYLLDVKSQLQENGDPSPDTSRGLYAPRVVCPEDRMPRGSYALWDVPDEEPSFEVINFLNKNSRRFSYTKDLCSLHIHGFYLYNSQGFIANKILLRTKKTYLNF